MTGGWEGEHRAVGGGAKVKGGDTSSVSGSKDQWDGEQRKEDGEQMPVGWGAKASGKGS